MLVAVAETIGSFRSESRFMTWLYQVARNKAVACLRQRGEPTMELGDHTGGAVRISSTIASRTTMAAVVAVLPHRYREADRPVPDQGG